MNELRSGIAQAKFADEAAVVEELLANPPYSSAQATRIAAFAADVVIRARNDTAGRALLDTFLTEYGLSNKEGIALMCLAESLLRIPDSPTAERLIADKIKFADWASHAGRSGSLLVNVSTWALLLGSKLVDVEPEFGSNPGEWLAQLTSRLSDSVIETAMRSAMRILGREFVLGRTIEEALENTSQNETYSFDMLGEAARDARSAERYFDAYMHAIRAVGSSERFDGGSLPSISIKLSALHPRYEYSQRQRVLDEMIPRVLTLCQAAHDANMELTVDAEEAERLDISLDVFELLATRPELRSFDGFGLAVQGYGKRATAVLDWLADLGRQIRRPIPVRLVKGAYWDAEIKHAQVHGYPGFPVFTRKSTTDLAYLVCARKILDHPRELFGQFATHNAHTLAAVMEIAGAETSFEFQRLHGMGETLYSAARDVYPRFPNLRTYAPVGRHDELLAYLVRRLLENGANSSFVNRFLDEQLAPADLVREPIERVRGFDSKMHPGIKLPHELFVPDRTNSAGVDLTDAQSVHQLLAEYRSVRKESFQVSSIVSGQSVKGVRQPISNPADSSDSLGECAYASQADVDRAVLMAAQAQPQWDALGGAARAQVLEQFADLLEENRPRLMGLLCREAGKTLPDAVDEVREAVDFCRYYAVQARERFAGPLRLPGPTGERNELYLDGRGVFVCISPWNFPLAIFTGQIAAALAAGNAVVAKPAEETPLIACEVIRYLHAAGVPADVCQLIIGDGSTGAALVEHPLTGGVAFTGGTDTARKIQISMAHADRPIAPLIAETGGQNALIVDSTALLEQVADDVVQSAFRSAGQRCSALRVLFLQQDIAEEALELIKGAMDELRVGDPQFIDTDVGPIISEQAARELNAHVDALSEQGKLLHQVNLDDACTLGWYVAPALFELDDISELRKEHFGPLLHVVQFAESEFDELFERIKGTGFGLTFGIHSRIGSRVQSAAKMAGAGNVYINRNMTGAVVGVQPFGGRGLSGTGPKAGGPNYLTRFATERVVTINTVATGGNAELLTLEQTDSE